jgi:hypothetical protein
VRYLYRWVRRLIRRPGEDGRRPGRASPAPGFDSGRGTGAAAPIFPEGAEVVRSSGGNAVVAEVMAPHDP